MIDAETFAEKLVVSGDHVIIIVLRKMRLHPVAGFGGFSVANAVGKNNEVSRGVEKLPWAKQLAGKDGLLELMTGAAGAVQNQNGVRDAALRIAR